MPAQDSEPVNAFQNSPDQYIPERLENILNALSEYHRYLLQKYTLQTQNPNALQGLEVLLEDRARIIKHFILFGTFPTSFPDPKLQICLQEIQKQSQPWDPKISTLSRHWCSLIFEQYPFTADHKHILQLLQNSLAEVENDGPEYHSEEEE